jgi:hypothetical protein
VVNFEIVGAVETRPIFSAPFDFAELFSAVEQSSITVYIPDCIPTVRHQNELWRERHHQARPIEPQVDVGARPVTGNGECRILKAGTQVEVRNRGFAMRGEATPEENESLWLTIEPWPNNWRRLSALASGPSAAMLTGQKWCGRELCHS